MHGESRALDLEKRGGHQKHQRRITALYFSLEEELEDLGHIGLSMARCFNFHPCKMLAECGKTEATVSLIFSLRFLGHLGFGQSTFLGIEISEDQGVLLTLRANALLFKLHSSWYLVECIVVHPQVPHHAWGLSLM